MKTDAEIHVGTSAKDIVKVSVVMDVEEVAIQDVRGRAQRVVEMMHVKVIAKGIVWVHVKLHVKADAKILVVVVV